MAGVSGCGNFNGAMLGRWYGWPRVSHLPAMYNRISPLQHHYRVRKGMRKGTNKNRAATVAEAGYSHAVQVMMMITACLTRT